MTAPRLVDARGLRCPWPLVRLARAMRENPGAVTLLADDPQVGRDLPVLAAERGWRVAEDTAAGGWRCFPAHPGEPAGTA